MASPLTRPEPGEHEAYLARYIALVPDGDIVKHLASQIEETLAVYQNLGEREAGFRYAPGKWSLREILGHVADAERVFAYRALRFMRNDPTPLAGFDENAWMPQAGFEARPVADLVEEFRAVRQATLALFRSATPETAARSGVANNHPITVRALAWVTAGHERHHARVIRERYLPVL